MHASRWLIVLAAAGAPAAAQVGEISVHTEGNVRIRTEENVQVRTDHHGRRALALVNAQGRHDTGAVTPRGDGWIPLGPFGGDVEDVNVSPVNSSIVLAGVAPAGSVGGTLFRSTDGGQNWAEVSALSGVSVYDVEFDPAGIAYIGTLDGVWKSTDGGASWTPGAMGIGLNDQVFDVEIDPNNSMVIWATVADAIGNQPVNLMRSPDAGVTWFDMTPPLAVPQSGSSVSVNPANSSEVVAAFAGAFGGGQVWVTTDGGITWEDRSFGLPDVPINVVVHTGTRILLGGGQAFGSQFLGLFESTDGGFLWNQLDDSSWVNPICNDVAIDPANPNILIAATNSGVHRSTDGGLTWQANVTGTTGASVNAVRFAPGSSTNVFLGASSRAVMRSTDGGLSFVASSAGIGALDVVSVESDPNNQNNLALAFEGLNDGGVYTSTDGGVTWSLEPTPGTRWNVARFAPDSTLYAISDGPTTIAPEALYRRETDGSWTSIGPDQGPFFESELFTVRFGVLNPNLIILGGNDFSNGWEMTVWRSADPVINWQKVVERDTDDSRSVQDVRIVQDGTEQTMLACFRDLQGDQIGGVLRSVNNGVDWVDSSAGLPTFLRGQALSPSPASPTTFYLADGGFGAGGIHFTTDAGQNWTTPGHTGRALDVVADPNDADVVYLLQSGAPKVQRSEDGGATFFAFDDGLASAGFSRDLFFSQGDTPRLLMGSGTGVFARTVTTPCPADLTGDSAVDVFDLLAYLDFWFDSDPAAEMTRDDPASIDVFDLLAYLDLWFAGC